MSEGRAGAERVEQPSMPPESPHAARLRALIVEVLRLGGDDFDPDLDMAATSTWDSLSHMELIAAIEDEFKVDLTADDIVEMTSVANIGSVLRAKGIAL